MNNLLAREQGSLLTLRRSAEPLPDKVCAFQDNDEVLDNVPLLSTTE